MYRLLEATMISRMLPEKIAMSVVVFTVLVISPLIPISLHAQVVGATLSGTVTDQSGAVIPNTQISIKNVATGLARVVATDPAGFYTAPNWLPGPYEITAAASGFATKVQTDITLSVGAEQVLNITMQVGQVT